MSYSEQRRAWNQMAHAKEWNANRSPDVLKLTFNSAAGAGVEQEPEPAPQAKAAETAGSEAAGGSGTKRVSAKDRAVPIVGKRRRVLAPRN